MSSTAARTAAATITRTAATTAAHLTLYVAAVIMGVAIVSLHAALNVTDVVAAQGTMGDPMVGATLAVVALWLVAVAAVIHPTCLNNRR